MKKIMSKVFLGAIIGGVVTWIALMVKKLLKK